MKEKLIYVENILDDINGQEGNIDGYCVFCKSTKYNGSVGIIHNKECVIQQLRQKIIDLNNSNNNEELYKYLELQYKVGNISTINIIDDVKNILER